MKKIKEQINLIRDYLLIKKSDLFDKEWYIKEYKDVAEAKIDPIFHYIHYGWKERKNPGPFFNTEEYMITNPDVLARDYNPLIHYLRFGKKEMRNPNKLQQNEEALYAKSANINFSIKILENWLISTEQYYGGLFEDIQRRNINSLDTYSFETLSNTDRISFDIYGEKYAEYLLPLVLRNRLDKYPFTIVVFDTLNGLWLALLANLFQNSNLIGIDKNSSLAKENLEKLKLFSTFNDIQFLLYNYDQINQLSKELNSTNHKKSVDICIDNNIHTNEEFSNIFDLILSKMADNFIFCTRNDSENYQEIKLQCPNLKVELFGEFIIISNNSINRYDNINQNLNHELNDVDWTMKIFQEVFGYPLNLQNPRTFNEKINVYKLFYREKPLWLYADKFLVQQYIEKKIGSKYLIPLIGVYNHIDEINYSTLPNQFVLKMNHGSGWNIICLDKNKLDWEKCNKQIREWESTNYYTIWREWAYKNIQPKILIQRLLLDSKEKVPLNYRFFCFSGKPLIIEVDHTIEYIDNFYNISWKQLPFIQNIRCNPKIIIPKPDNLDEMLDIASKLSEGFPFVRIDLFAIPDIFFGEMTFYPGAGLSKFSPAYWDLKIGEYWI